MKSRSISDRLTKTIKNQLRETHFVRLIVAVSGGADSTALLSLLKNAGVETVAAHCNFHLRGEESNRDQSHIEEICRRLNVPLEIIHFDVKEYIRLHPGISTEMACRELRYDWFGSIIQKYDADRVAVAHNADDNIETLFLNLLRGSGTSGLRGMLPDNGNVWRPLLNISRTEIEKYLQEVDLDYITDSTNLENDYRRNFLRNEVIPLLKSRWEGFDKALSKSIAFLRAENSVVEQAIDKLLPPDGSPLASETVLDFPNPALLVRRFISPLLPFSTTPDEVVAAMKADKPDVRRWQLKKGKIELRNRKLFLKKDV
ncbi:MAG: tRNA lysidine(34) synthetase TilS [Muribaculaceae bacterium]|nr:tRNA lysidine(34) synthetase TilS [Muribaculaceae bacterium]